MRTIQTPQVRGVSSKFLFLVKGPSPHSSMTVQKYPASSHARKEDKGKCTRRIRQMGSVERDGHIFVIGAQKFWDLIL